MNLCLDEENAHQQIDQILTSALICHYYLVSWCKLQIHTVGGPYDLSVGVYTEYRALGLHRTVENHPHKCFHLK